MGESFADDAKKTLKELLKRTLQLRDFDYLRQGLVFNYIYKNTDYFKNIKYLILDDGKTALVYPENYETASVNTERDMELLVGHLDFMAKEAFLADSISLCSTEEELERRLDTPVIQEDSPVMDNNT